MKCLVCHKDVEYPEFQCGKRPGAHVVEPKTYYHAGSARIQSLKDRRAFSPTVVLRSDTNRVDANGNIVSDAPLMVQFRDAMYQTSNPEEQYFLEEVGAQHGVRWGEEGLNMWRKNQLTALQQVELQKAELADVQRQIRESNDLLSQVKARQASKA